MARLQCDQFRWFLQILGNKLSHKSCPNILVIFGLFLIISISFKKCVATFWAFLWGNLGNFLFHHLVTLLVCLAWPDKFDALYWSSVLESKISSDRLWDDSNEIKKSTLKGFFLFGSFNLVNFFPHPQKNFERRRSRVQCDQIWKNFATRDIL